jgi:hypothetical protein
MQKINPATRDPIRRGPSLAADVMCVILGQGIYEFEREDGDWALVSPSEFERLKATGEPYAPYDTSVGLWCQIAVDGKSLFERLNVEDMAAAVAAHRSLLALWGSSPSTPSPSIVSSLQFIVDSDVPSAQVYACVAACSWCAASVIAAKALAVPLIQSISRLRFVDFAPLVRSNVHSCAWALAADLTLSHPSDAGDVLSALLVSSIVGDNDDRTAAALDGLGASISTMERRSALIKAGLLPLLLEPLKRRDKRTVFLSALSVCSRMCDRLLNAYPNLPETNPYQKKIVASGVLPRVIAAFECPFDADIQGAASQVLLYLTRSAADELVDAGIPALKHKLLQESSDINVLNNILISLNNYFTMSMNKGVSNSDVFTKLGTPQVIVSLLAHDNPNIKAKASFAITAFANVVGRHYSGTLSKLLCEAGAVGALAGVVSKESGEVRKQACGALWSIVLVCEAGLGAVDIVKELLVSDREEDVKAWLEGLSAAIISQSCSPLSHYYVHRFGVGRLVGLLSHDSACLQAKACEVIRALTEGGPDHYNNQRSFRDGGAVDGLTRLLEIPDVQESARDALWCISGNGHVRHSLHQIMLKECKEISVTYQKYFGEAGCRILAHALLMKPRTSTASFLFRDVPIGSAGASWICPALAHLTSLTSLRLVNTDLECSGISHLTSALTHLMVLTELDLSSNNLTGNDGARICGAAAAAGMTRLQILKVDDNLRCCDFDLLNALHRQRIIIWRSVDAVTVPLIAIPSLSLPGLKWSASEHAAVSFSVVTRILLGIYSSIDIINTRAAPEPLFHMDPTQGGCGPEGEGFTSQDTLPGLTATDVPFLSHLLSFNTCITDLQLIHNNIGSAAVELIESLTHLTSLTHLKIDDALITADIAADILRTACRARLTHISKLELACHPVVTTVRRNCCAMDSWDETYQSHEMSASSTFSASDVLQSATWLQLQLPQPPNEIVRAGYGAILQYMFSTDKVSVHELRIFVVGESTVSFFHPPRQFAFFLLVLFGVHQFIWFVLFLSFRGVLVFLVHDNTRL